MEAMVLENERIGIAGRKAKITHAVRERSFPWWRFFLELLKMSIQGPFVSQWEKETGLPWREG